MADRKRTSQCMCGQVQIEMSGEPGVMAYCHCNSCRGWLNAPLQAIGLFRRLERCISACVRAQARRDDLG